jgi:thymidine kinase
MVLRVDDEGNIMADGSQIEIGGEERYVSVCRKHFKEKKIA